MAMKVLMVGDASNMHQCLATELRRQGHHVVVASEGSRWMNTARDIDLLRRPGKWGTMRFLAALLRALPQMRGYDVVQLAGTIFLPLKPARLKAVLRYLRRNNGHVVLSAMATDYVFFQACHDHHTFKYSEYCLGDQPAPYVSSDEYRAQHQDNWRTPMMRDYSDFILSNVDAAVACLYEYYTALQPVMGDRLHYAGIPVDTSTLQPIAMDTAPTPVRLMVGVQRDRMKVKGVDILLEAARRVQQRYPELCTLDVVENVPYSEYVERMRHAHVLLDQLYSYTPATQALLAMAQGIVAVSGGEQAYYDFIGETELHPIVNVSPLEPDDAYRKIEDLVVHRDQLPQLSAQSREFVMRHNAASVVAQRYLDCWQRL